MSFFKRLVALLSLVGVVGAGATQASPSETTTAYDYAFTNLSDGTPLPLSSYRNKVILIVNTASECGFTKQYADLETLYKQYRDQGLVVLGVPSNDFGNQEPGDDASIKHFCSINYGVTFPMTGKTIVSGQQAHPFYQWAHKRLGFGTAPKWNFHKYLINRQGELVDYFNSTTSPSASSVKQAIEACLAE